VVCAFRHAFAAAVKQVQQCRLQMQGVCEPSLGISQPCTDSFSRSCTPCLHGSLKLQAAELQAYEPSGDDSDSDNFTVTVTATQMAWAFDRPSTPFRSHHSSWGLNTHRTLWCLKNTARRYQVTMSCTVMLAEMLLHLQCWQRQPQVWSKLPRRCLFCMPERHLEQRNQCLWARCAAQNSKTHFVLVTELKREHAMCATASGAGTVIKCSPHAFPSTLSYRAVSTSPHINKEMHSP